MEKKGWHETVKRSAGKAIVAVEPVSSSNNNSTLDFRCFIETSICIRQGFRDHDVECEKRNEFRGFCGLAVAQFSMIANVDESESCCVLIYSAR